MNFQYFGVVWYFILNVLIVDSAFFLFTQGILSANLFKGSGDVCMLEDSLLNSLLWLPMFVQELN